MIAVLAVTYPLEVLSELLQVSRSSYYRFRKGQTYQPSSSKQAQLAAVKRVFSEHKRNYGSRRILAELQQAELMKIGRYQVRMLMRQADLTAKRPRSFVPKTTNSRHGQRACRNLLLDEQGKFIGLPTTANRIWVSDITYIRLVSGEFIYLGTWLDLFSRMIVGWQVDETMEESLLIKSLDKALQWRSPPPGLIVHSDRGGHYFSRRLRKLLTEAGCLQSMCRADKVYDNSYAESFFSRFKTELIDKGAFLSLADARTEIFEFIEIYYNRKRRHSALGYKSPLAYENGQWPS